MFLVGGFFIFGVLSTDNVATVNGHDITRTVFDAELEKKIVFYQHSEQEVDTATLQKDVLDQLIDKQIVEAYAEENEIHIDDEAVNNYYNQRVSSYDNEQAFLADLRQLYGLDKPAYLENVRYELLREAVQQHVDQPLTDWLETERSNSKIIIKL